MANERRIKLVNVSADDILGFFLESPLLKVYKFKDLPDGTKILNVGFSYASNGFTFVVTHPSFPVVSIRDVAETVESEVSFVRLSEQQRKQLSNFLGHV